MKRCLFTALAVFVFCMINAAQARAGVRIATGTDKPYVLADSDDSVFVKVGLRGDERAAPANRLPLNIAIVLDKSGSMGSDYKMENAKAGAVEIVERLNEFDVFSLVVYDTQAFVAIPAQRVLEKEAIISLINGIYASGSTALHAGVRLAGEELKKNMSDEHINRIILLSDGLANVGPSSTPVIAQLGTQLAEMGIAVTTIGVGLDYNEDLMTALARESEGNSYFARDASDLPQIFAQEIGESMTFAAKDIDIDFECESSVKPVSIIGRTGQLSDKRARVHIENVYGKSEKFALFEIKLPARKHAKNLKVGRVNIAYLDPYTKKTIKENRDITICYDKDQAKVARNRDKAVHKDVALTKASQAKAQVVSLSDLRKFSDAAVIMQQSKVELEKAAKECNNDAVLLNEAKKSANMQRLMDGRKSFNKMQRKGIMNEAFSTQNQQSYSTSYDLW